MKTWWAWLKAGEPVGPEFNVAGCSRVVLFADAEAAVEQARRGIADAWQRSAVEMCNQTRTNAEEDKKVAVEQAREAGYAKAVAEMDTIKEQARREGLLEGQKGYFNPSYLDDFRADERKLERERIVQEATGWLSSGTPTTEYNKGWHNGVRDVIDAIKFKSRPAPEPKRLERLAVEDMGSEKEFLTINALIDAENERRGKV